MFGVLFSFVASLVVQGAISVPCIGFIYSTAIVI